MTHFYYPHHGPSSRPRLVEGFVNKTTFSRGIVPILRRDLRSDPIVLATIVSPIEVVDTIVVVVAIIVP